MNDIKKPNDMKYLTKPFIIMLRLSGGNLHRVESSYLVMINHTNEFEATSSLKISNKHVFCQFNITNV